MCGIAYGPDGSVLIVSAAVVGFTSIFALTITCPRLNGPATAGLTIDRPYGAHSGVPGVQGPLPLYGPVTYTFPPVTLYGFPPRPTLTIVSPIKLSAPHAPSLACGSPHN